MLINNFDSLATSPQRKTLLEIIEAGLVSIQPEENFKKTVTFENNTLSILDQTYDLNNFDHVYLIGFGKGAATNSKLLEDLLGDRLSEGYVIDTTEQEFKKIEFSLG